METEQSRTELGNAVSPGGLFLYKPDAGQWWSGLWVVDLHRPPGVIPVLLASAVLV